MNFDEFERRLGQISTRQVIIICVCALVLLGTSSMAQTAVYLSAVPEYRCSFGEYEELFENISFKNVSSSFIPPDDSCLKYSYNISGCRISQDEIICSNDSEVQVVPCSEGYVYDKAYFQRTTVTEWNLVCRRTTLDALANSVYFAGMLVGSFFVGLVLDWFGRKKAILLTALLFSATGIACSFSPSYVFYIFMRVAVAAFGISYFIAYYTYALEIGGKNYRLHIGSFTQVATGVIHTILPVIAYLLNDWRNICLAFGAISLPIIIVFPFLPESPRWLLTQGRDQEAEAVMERFARSGNTKFPENDWKSVVEIERELCAEENKKASLRDLFRFSRMRLVTFVTMLNWFTVSMVFYGLTLNIGTLSGDPYINRVCNGFVEIIGYVLYMMPAKYLGRRISLSLGFGIAGMCCLSTMLLAEFANGRLWMLQLSRWAAILGKLFTTVAFGLVFQHAGEAYPTIARGSALSVGSMSARIGSIIMPWTLELQRTHSWLTQTTFGGMSLIAGAASLLLPETKNSGMTTTLHEANDFYKQEMHLANRLIFERVSPELRIETLSEDSYERDESIDRKNLLSSQEESTL